MAYLSSCVHNKSYQYDVFLSFSGEDTRKTFVDHLYAALDQQGISTFKDDEKLEKGKKIKDDLLQSIEDSRLYIIVFSKRYASSSWCLNELLKIMQCHKTNEHMAFPVFYDVDPYEVRKQSGLVGEAIATHKDKNELEVGKWREALTEAANLSGWDVRKTADGHEAKVIKLIIEKVSLELRLIDISVDENLVGMEQRMQDLDSCLEIGSNDVRMIGIKGMGGSGKTTLAWAIFDKISCSFEGKSFVENVRERASQIGLKKLQKQILKDILHIKDVTITDVHNGKCLMKKLCGKKVLLVLDDVDHKEQLEMLAGDSSWFKTGSRVIITTRDEQVLDSHRVKWIHDVSLLSKEEAMRLFSRHTFGQDIPPQEFERLSFKVVHYAAGLPLTVKVLGSNLCGKVDSEWTYVLERLKTIPLKETLKKLEISYENLEDDLKEIFLNVACFLKGWKKDDAIRMLDSCGCYAKYGLRVLEKKSLIVSLKNCFGSYIVQMHDHLVEMGINIVRREHPDEPDKHSRLWVQEEVEHNLASGLVNVVTKYIDLKITSNIVLEGFRNMKKLRCLIVKGHGGSLKIDKLAYFPDSLRYISWCGYPHWCLPKTFEADNLVALTMINSKIKQLWKGRKVMKKLKFLDLSGSMLLKSLDLGLTPNLERLNLEHCFDLVKLYVHGGCLKSLVYLNLVECSSLKSFLFIEQLESLEVLHTNREIPASIGNLHKLVSLFVNSCFTLKGLPGSICSLQHLKTLDIQYSCFIEELPEDFGRLECLESLNLSYSGVKRLPCSICKLKHLKTLLLKRCYDLEKLPEDVGHLVSLVELSLEGCKGLRDVPDSICKLKHLKVLNLQSCWRLEKLSDNLGDLKCLRLLNIRDTSITHLPHGISLLKGLKILDDIPLWYKYDIGNHQEVHEAIGHLERLQVLSLSSTNIKHLPNSICMLKHLKTLDLQFCYSIKEVPEALGQLECLEELKLSCTDVKHLPDSICMLKRLKKLILQHCVLLEKLPADVGQLESLVVLNLARCYSIRDIPNSICMLKQLKVLNLYHCFRLEKLPEEVGELESLKDLFLSRCSNIRDIPNSIGMLKHLKFLALHGCRKLNNLPDEVGDLEGLQELTIWDTRITHLPQSISLLNGLKIHTQNPEESSDKEPSEDEQLSDDSYLSCESITDQPLLDDS